MSRRLQTVIFPSAEICGISEMYYRSQGEVCPQKDSLLLRGGASVSFDTYFGGFFAAAWLRYTPLTSVGLRVRLAGSALLRFVRIRLADGDIVSEPLGEYSVTTPMARDIVFDDLFSDLDGEYMYAFSVTAKEDTLLYGGEYYCADDIPARDINLAVDICTFRREKYVERNMDILRRYILDCPDSPLHGHMDVIISDNGGTLLGEYPNIAGGGISVLKSRNLGGVGGFTNGMREALGRDRYTHVLLMDDDAVIDPYAIERTAAFLSLLREEYRDRVNIGGALMREDTPWMQYESGARWLGGAMDVIGHGVDLRSLADILPRDNGVIDYNGWWYTCIPLCMIDEMGLPLPLFIHRDDVEYGLRTCDHGGIFVTLPGVGVWHEAFERKMSGTSEYYDIRNTAIVNALHCPQYGAKQMKKFLRKWVTKNLFSLRIKYVEMNLRGARDFLRGADWLASQDGEELHREISGMNYKNSQVLPESDVPAPENPSRIKKLMLSAASVALLGGLWMPVRRRVIAVQPSPIWRCFAARSAIHCDETGRGYEVRHSASDIHRCIADFRAVCREIDEGYDRAAESFRKFMR